MGAARGLAGDPQCAIDTQTQKKGETAKSIRRKMDSPKRKTREFLQKGTGREDEAGRGENKQQQKACYYLPKFWDLYKRRKIIN